MYDSESDESDKPSSSDDESGHLGQSNQDESNKQLSDEKHSPSVKPSKTSVACTTGGHMISYRVRHLLEVSPQTGQSGGSHPKRQYYTMGGNL